MPIAHFNRYPFVLSCRALLVISYICDDFIHTYVHTFYCVIHTYLSPYLLFVCSTGAVFIERESCHPPAGGGGNVATVFCPRPLVADVASVVLSLSLSVQDPPVVIAPTVSVVNRFNVGSRSNGACYIAHGSLVACPIYMLHRKMIWKLGHMCVEGMQLICHMCVESVINWLRLCSQTCVDSANRVIFSISHCPILNENHKRLECSFLVWRRHEPEGEIHDHVIVLYI